jgi:competence ComEA-like helix-hairpin-helix protein
MTERKNIFSKGDIWAILFLLACILIGGAIMIYQKSNRNKPPELIIETVSSSDRPLLPTKATARTASASQLPRISLNTAPADSFELLDGIGPVYAERIVEYRRKNGSFRSLKELMEVKGIGPVVFENIKNYLTLE